MPFIKIILFFTLIISGCKNNNQERSIEPASDFSSQNVDTKINTPQAVEIIETVPPEVLIPAPFISNNGGGLKFDACNNACVSTSECITSYCDEERAVCVQVNKSLGTQCGIQKQGICDADDTCNGFGECIDVKETGVKCRESQNDCDLADFCNGVDNDCPNTFVSEGMACGPNVDPSLPCDKKDRCDGQGNCVDIVHSFGVYCENSDESECELADFCDGVTKTCPTSFAIAGDLCGESAQGPCDSHDICDGQGVCTANRIPQGQVCERAHEACFLESVCDGISSNCVQLFADVGTPCGPFAQGQCNEQHLCVDDEAATIDYCSNGTGTQPDADSDNFSTACDCDDTDPAVYPGALCDTGNICTPSYCDGATAMCVPAGFAYPGTPCGSDSSSSCEDDPVCDSNGNCTLKPAQGECRAANGACDAPEYCDGVSTSCPPDGVDPAGTVCGPDPSEVCVGAPECDGISKTCSDSSAILPDGISIIPKENCTETTMCSVGVSYCVDLDLSLEAQTIFSDDVEEKQYFATSVALHGNYAIIGDPGYNDGLGAVFVYLFEESETASVTLIARVENPGRTPSKEEPQGKASEAFGQSVSIYNNLFAVGAPNADGYYDQNTSDSNCDLGNQNDNAGAVYVFKINPDNSITNEQRLQGANIGFPQDQENNCSSEPDFDQIPASDTNFGYDVAIGETYLVAGAPKNVSGATGSAWTYYLNGSTWTNLQQISSSLSDSEAQFGFSVALSPNQKILAIGAPFHDKDSNNANNGNVQTFISDGMGGSFSSYVVNVTGDNANDQYGFDVALTDNLLAVGLPHRNGYGAVILYAVDEGSLGSDQIFYAPNPSAGGNEQGGQQFGAAISLDKTHNGHSMLVGAPNYYTQNPGTYGYFAFYSINQSTQTIVPSDFVLLSTVTGSSINWDPGCGGIDNNTGFSVATDSNRLLVGANLLDYSECGEGSSTKNAGGAVSLFFPY